MDCYESHCKFATKPNINKLPLIKDLVRAVPSPGCGFPGLWNTYTKLCLNPRNCRIRDGPSPSGISPSAEIPRAPEVITPLTTAYPSVSPRLTLAHAKVACGNTCGNKRDKLFLLSTFSQMIYSAAKNKPSQHSASGSRFPFFASEI